MEENYNILDVVLPEVEKDNVKQSRGYQALVRNNMDTAEFTGGEVDADAGPVPTEHTNDELKQFGKDFFDFVVSIPVDTMVGISRAGANSTQKGIQIGRFIADAAGIDYAVDDLSAINDKIEKFKGSLNEYQEDSPFITKLLGYAAQEGSVVYPMYRKFKSMGIPKSYAMLLSFGIGGTLALGPEDQLTLDSKTAKYFKDVLNVEEDTPAEDIYNMGWSAMENTAIGGAFDNIIEGLQFGKQIIKGSQIDQGAIAVGSGTAAGAAVNEATEEPKTEQEQFLEDKEKFGKPQTQLPDDNQFAGGAAVFKSMLREASKKLPNKGSGQQFLGQLKNQPGIKEAELKWTGLDDYLKKNKTVTKEQVKDYLLLNKVEVTETEYASPFQKLFSDLQDDFYEDYAVTEAMFDKAKKAGLPEKDLAKLDDFFETRQDIDLLVDRGTSDNLLVFIDGKNQNFSITQLDDNLKREIKDLYRNEQFVELNETPIYHDLKNNKLTLYQPEGQFKKGSLDTDAEQYTMQNVARELLVREYTQYLNSFGPNFKTPGFEYYTAPGGENYKTLVFSLPEIKSLKTSQVDIPGRGEPITIKEPGTIEYTGSHYGVPGEFAHVRYKDRNIQGKSTLFIEEMQSDLVQAMARKGELSSTEFPFKNNWYELVIKRLIREAADKGFDQVAIPSGIAAARRYGLTKNVRGLSVSREVVGRRGSNEAIFVTYDEGSDFITREEVKKQFPQYYDDVVNYLDNNVMATTDKFMEYPGKLYDDVTVSNNNMDLTFTKSADRLPADKKGKVELYDKSIPSFMKKYGKKWNANFKTIDTSAEELSMPYQMELKVPPKTEPYRMSTSSNERSRRERAELLRDFKVFILEITPEMKKSVQEDGQALFNYFGIGTAGAAVSQGVLDSQGNNTISQPTNN